MSTTRVCVAPNVLITQREFAGFLRQFRKGLPLGNLTLCNRLKREWLKSIGRHTQLRGYSVDLQKGEATPPTMSHGRHLSRHMPKGEEGVYAIFARYIGKRTFRCFYVGISEADIHRRFLQHLQGDIRKNYRGAFKQLKEADEIVLCYAATPLALHNQEKVTSKLELLESCLTVALRPEFLINAAE